MGSKGGGSQTTTTTQQIDPRIWGMVQQNVDRATGIANQGFTAYNGNPYTGMTTGGTPATPGYYTGGELTGYDEYGQPQYNPSSWVEGTPGTPGTSPTFNASNFVAPLSANQNMAINAAPGIMGAGQGATNAAVSGAAGLLNYRPQSVMPATANSNTANASGYNASILGNAPQMQAANATGVAADTSTVNRGDVQSLAAQTGSQGMSAYQNPYQQQVIDAALGDIERSRQLAIGSNQDAAIAARAFGGSRQGVADALTNEAYGRTAANTAANLRAQGFDTAAGLAQQDASRNLQAQSANQGIDLSVAGQNASARNAGSQFNAGLLTGVNQYNAGNQQAANSNNLGILSQYGLANQGALNQAGQYNAGNQQAANLFNAGALNSGNQFNAGVINQAQAQNQQAGLSGAQINAGAAGLLGNLGQQQQGMYGNGLNALLQTGALGQQNQQAALDAAYQEFLRQQNYPFVGQNLINQSLGLLPQGGTTTQTGPNPNNTGGVLGGLGSVLGGVAGLLAL